jgi:integrase
VVLIPPDPDGRHPTWRARYEDPDLKRTTKERLDPVALRTAEARRDWAVRKSRALAKRRMELEAGAPRATGTGLEVAVERFFEDRVELRPRTREIYRKAAKRFLAWASKVGLHSADDVTKERLVAFRAARLKEGRHAAVAGGKRGEKAAGGKMRAPATVNVELRSIRTILGYLRGKLNLLPRVTTDDLRDGLERLRMSSGRVDYRKPAELQKLLDAALEHDAEVYAATRDEHAGRGEPGSTTRYPAIAPFVAFVLLTGMRLNEALGLDWKRVDLEALDNDGKLVGEIHLRAEDTKTKKARTVGLEVSPALRALLEALKERDGEKGPVFSLTVGEATAAEKRLAGQYEAPDGCNWQALRRTAGTFLTNAPGIYGSASVFLSARQLGHSVAVAEKHYLGVVRGIPKDARDLETAMHIGAQMERVIASVSARHTQTALAAGG